MNTPDSAPSEFTRELIDELTRDHYRLHAWRTFLSKSWLRSMDDIKRCPSLTRSFLYWTCAVFTVGAGVILLSWPYHPHGVALYSLAYWLPWYAMAVVFVLTHLGMADSGDGASHSGFLVPNVLSFTRLALAPVVLAPCLTMPVHAVTGPVFAAFIAAISLSDVLDGWLARRRGVATRLGQMLDYLADLAFLTFLTVGLYLAGAIPGTLLWLLIVRYPLTIVAALILYFTRGPAPLNPTFFGRATTFATSIVLLLIAFSLLLNTGLPSSSWVVWSVRSLQLLVGANIIYLVYRGMNWGKHQRAIR